MSGSAHKPFGAKSYFAKSAAITGADMTPEMLAKINTFALVPLTSDQVYARKFLFCHSAIDRDNERFTETLLDDFSTTFPGKSFIFAHDRSEFLPLGLFFDSYTEVMAPDAFKALTGEAPLLPEGIATVKVVWAWAYMLREHRKEIIDNMDAGVYRHVSIGFGAADIRPVKKDINGPTLYWEYVGPGETREGSLVYLGAQPGATAQKALKNQEIKDKGDTSMKMIVAMLFGLGMKTLTETATEEQITAGIKSLIEEKNAKIKALETDAALGKAFKEKTVDDYAALKQKMGEAGGDTAAALTSMKALASALPFDFLTAEVKSLQARVEAKFPTTGQLEGDANTDKSAGEGNPLIPKESK